MSGFCIDGFIGRFAAAQFGQRNAGSPLNALMRCIQWFLARRRPPPAPRPQSQRPLDPLDPTVKRGLHPQALHTVVWVDDTVFATKTPPHPPCAGLDGGCPVCARTTRTARRSQHYWHRLAHALGLGLSDEKRQEPSQSITYTGIMIVVDSFRHTLSIPPEKKARLAACLEEFLLVWSATAHEIASLRGRLQHYFCCLPYVLPFVALFSSLHGTEAEPYYNRPIDIPLVVNDTAAFLHAVPEDYAFHGRRLWPLVASTLHAAFLAGETGSAHIVVVTWDASLHGWDMVLRWWANCDGKTIVGTLTDSPDMQHQIRRETQAKSKQLLQ